MEETLVMGVLWESHCLIAGGGSVGLWAICPCCSGHGQMEIKALNENATLIPRLQGRVGMGQNLAAGCGMQHPGSLGSREPWT